MAQAKRPSLELKDKKNVNPSLVRKNEAVDLDFHDIYETLFDHAEKIDGFTGGNTGNIFYGFHSTLELLIGSYPDVQEDSFAIIEGLTPQIAQFKNGEWIKAGGNAPFIFLDTRLERPDIGTEKTWYIVKDSNTAWLWYDGKYHEFVMPDLSNYYTKEESDERYATAEQGEKADSAIQEESDPTVPDHVKSITAQDLANFTQAFQEGLLSGTVTGQENKTVTLTKRNGEVIQFSFEDRYNSDTGDGVIDGFVFNKDNGTVTIQTSAGEVITDNFDGRYALLGHKHNFSELEGTENIEKKRTPKLITNTTQYTYVTEDFTDKVLYFTGNASNSNGEITAILNQNIAPENGEIIAYRIGNAVINNVGGTGVTLYPTPGNNSKVPYETGKHSLFGMKAVQGINDISVYGTLEFTGDLGINNYLSGIQGNGNNVVSFLREGLIHINHDFSHSHSEYDKYSRWQVGANGSFTDIYSNQKVNFISGDNITINRNGQSITISATGGGTADSVSWNAVTGKPTVFPPSSHSHSASDLPKMVSDIGINQLNGNLIVSYSDGTSSEKSFASLIANEFKER